MSRKERFTPQEKEQACIDYIEGNRSRSEICRELYISTSTMNISVRRVLPHFSFSVWSLIPKTKMNVKFLYSKFYKIRIFATEPAARRFIC